MICTFGDITDVTWWRELQLPVRAVIQPDGTLGAQQWGAPGWESEDPARAQRHYDELARLSAAKARAKIVEQLRESGDLVGEPRSDHACREVLREGRSAARDHHEPAVVLQDDRVPRGAARARPRARMASGLHAGAVRELGERPERRLVRQPSALLRRAVSGLVSGRRRWPGRSRPSGRAEDQLPIDPSTDVPDGYRADQRGSRAVRRRSRRHGHLGDLVAHAADRLRLAGRRRVCSRGRFRWICARRRTTSSARGSSTRCCARISSTIRCRGRTRRSRAGCSTPTARRCRSPRATS